jgi:hypothetical protein
MLFVRAEGVVTAALDTLRRENEALKASIADAEAQVDELERHLDGESNGQGATAASPALGSQTATFANAGEESCLAMISSLDTCACCRMDLATRSAIAPHLSSSQCRNCT